MHPVTTAACFAAALPFATIAQTPVPPSYRVTELPTLGGMTSLATGISNSGWVVGQSSTPSGYNFAFRWRDGVMQALPPRAGSTQSGAFAVNDAGDVAGFYASVNATTDSSSQPCLWRQGGVAADLDPFDRGLGGAAMGVNAGVVTVGWLSVAGGGTISGFRAAGGTTTPITLPTGDTCHISYATDLTDAGIIVGYAAPPDQCGDTAAWSHTQGVTTLLPGLSWRSAVASAVNAAGDIAGRAATDDNRTLPVVWRGGLPVALESRGGNGSALDINALGDVVGQVFVSVQGAPSKPSACVWIGEHLYSLRDLIIGDLDPDAATAINDHGEIAAYGLNASGRLRGFLLTPFCIGDFNGDGGIDNSDTQTFFEAWEEGDFDADVNGDGGIDGADVERFFERWEAGRC